MLNNQMVSTFSLLTLDCQGFVGNTGPNKFMTCRLLAVFSPKIHQSARCSCEAFPITTTYPDISQISPRYLPYISQQSQLPPFPVSLIEAWLRQEAVEALAHLAQRGDTEAQGHPQIYGQWVVYIKIWLVYDIAVQNCTEVNGESNSYGNFLYSWNLQNLKN